MTCWRSYSWYCFNGKCSSVDIKQILVLINTNCMFLCTLFTRNICFGTPSVVGIPPTKTFTIVFISCGKHLSFPTASLHWDVSSVSCVFYCHLSRHMVGFLLFIHLFTFARYFSEKTSVRPRHHTIVEKAMQVTWRPGMHSLDLFTRWCFYTHT